MIARITNVAVAVTITMLGLVPGRAQAQTPAGPPDATVATGVLADDGGGVGTVCTSCGDPSCAGEWVSNRRFGLQHHSNCSCPRCYPRHTWASFDALMWWGKGRSTPPLVSNGVLPPPPTNTGTTLFGGGTVGNAMAAGARADFGFWFDDYETLGIGAKVWGLDGDADGFHAASDAAGSPVLARPFFNVVQDQEDTLLTASPGVLAGNINAATSSSVLAAEAYLRSAVLVGRGYTLDLVGGYHFLRFDDDLSVFSNSTVIDPSGGVPVGTIINVLDDFGTQNEFHGGSIGLAGEARHGRWTLGGLAKVSVGNMHQTVDIGGYQSITTPGDPTTTTPGGVLAQPTNMGQYARDVTAWIPEFGVNAGYDVRNWMRLTVGYNFLLITNVALAGDQIDRGVNPTQFGGNPLIGPARPAFTFEQDEYWLQGLTLGATILY